LNVISFPDYGAVLVITDTTTQLTEIPFHSKGQVNIKETFDIPDMNGKVKLKVVTDFSGSFADGTRSDFKSTSNYELRKTYTDYYANYLKNIKADSLTYSDNENTGVFTTVEYYTLENLWDNAAGIKKTSFEPYVINSLLKEPDGKNRTMPYVLRFPANYTEEIHINLPETWNNKNSDHESESSAFKLHAEYTCTGKKMVLKYNYKALKDHVMPDEVGDYLKKVKKAEEGLAYNLTYTTTVEAAPIFYSNNRYLALYVALGLCVFITYTSRRRNKSNEY
jgi:hypothetical protein